MDIPRLNGIIRALESGKNTTVCFQPAEPASAIAVATEKYDGVLYEMLPVPKGLAMPLVSRVKVLAKLNISERRLPQDGRVEIGRAHV